MSEHNLDPQELNSIFHECRQCGACCRKFRKIFLYPDEAEFIKKMGGHVGVDIHLNDIIQLKSIDDLLSEAKDKGKIYMIHPDNHGCVFLEKRNGKYICKIYHYRPRTCRGFKCNFADGSFTNIFGEDSTCLLGIDRFGLPLK